MKKIALLLLCLNLFSTKACALSFTQLQLLLQKNSKQLELKKYDIDISKEDMNIINSENYPTLTSGFNIEDSKSLNQNSNTSVGDNNLVTDSLKKSYAYLSLNYNLYSFGRFDNKKKIQEYKIESIKYDYCKEKKDLTIRLLDLYSNALNYQIKIENLEKILEERNSIYELKERLFNIGQITKIDITKSAIDVADLYSQISDNKKELKNIYNQIYFLTDYSFSKNDYLETLFFEDFTLNIDFDDSSNAKVILSQIKEKQYEILFYEKEYLPNLNFYSKYDFYGYDQKSYKTSIDDLRENSYRFGVNLSINLFDGFRTFSLKQKASLELKQLQTKYNLEKDKFDYEILISNQNYKIDKENLENKLKNIELSTQKLENTKKLENIGEIAKIESINSKIETLYKNLEYELNKGKLAYEYTKRKIYKDVEKCIVH